MSVVLRPDRVTAERLEQAMTEVEEYAGSGHFRTGGADSVHFTVRALELYRETVNEEEVRRQLARFHYEDSASGRLIRPGVLDNVRTGPFGQDNSRQTKAGLL